MKYHVSKPVDGSWEKAVLEMRQTCTGPVVFCPDPCGTGMSALARNVHRSSNTKVITLPNFDPAVVKAFHADEVEDYGGYVIEAGNFRALAESMDAMLFDPLHFFPLGGELADNLREAQRVSMGGYYHSDRACALEKDRAFGKKIAEEIGLKVLAYRVVDDKTTDLSAAIRQIPGARVVLKYNEAHFIGIYDRNSALQMLPEMVKNGPVCVEQYVPNNREINFCFMVGEKAVQPLCTLVETNRLLPNNTGGKTGTAWAYHQAAETYSDGTPVDPHFKTIYESMVGLNYSLGGTHVQGWIDVSFMIGDTGELYFTEWMVRHACSNFATLLHQMEMSFFDLHKAVVREGRALSSTEIWRTSCSVGVEVYHLPLPTSDGFSDYWSSAGIEAIQSKGYMADIVMDLLAVSASFDGEKYLLENEIQRVAVVSMNTYNLPDLIDFYVNHPQNRQHVQLNTGDYRSLNGFLDGLCHKIPALAYRMAGN